MICPGANHERVGSEAHFRAERADRIPVVDVRSESRSSCSSIDGRAATARRKASAVKLNPGGTRIPSIRDSSPGCAPLPPTTATWESSTSSNPARRCPSICYSSAVAGDRWQHEEGSLRQAPLLAVRYAWRGKRSVRRTLSASA